MKRALAIDIGASSGRHILGEIENGKMQVKEIYRFENGMKNEDGSLTWDVEKLFSEIKHGIKRCKDLGEIPETIAIDTWGVDYVLLDEAGKEILPVYAYRDGRTYESVKKVEELLGREALYEKTGIQKQSFNTIYQLYCDKEAGRLKSAKRFLMMPEYFTYRLTGKMLNEYTNASTTNLVNAKEKAWDSEISEKLGIDSRLFEKPLLPPFFAGGFTDEIKDEIGFDANVILAPSHDTASAVAACPITKGGIFISSGTWSLIGTENEKPILTLDAMNANFTNEGGINYKFRFLKNIMGMWLFQGIKKSLLNTTYDEMMKMAMESDFKERFDPNDPSLTAPSDMLSAIRALLKDDLSTADVLSSVYHSLAFSYAEAAQEIEKLTGKKCGSICIMGGGSKDDYLNHLTKEYTGKKVFAGPTEATAIGNLLSQFMYIDKTITLEKGREIIKESFNILEV